MYSFKNKSTNKSFATFNTVGYEFPILIASYANFIHLNLFISTSSKVNVKKSSILKSKFNDKCDFDRFARLRSGKIALQDHGNKVSFRNIKIRKL